MQKVYNFCAGPAAIPAPVLQQVKEELLDYNHSGVSIMEMSHRGPAFTEILHSAETLLRELMKVPEHYKILFIQGGASAQFGLIPMNLSVNKKADFIDTGVWSSKAIKESEKLLNVSVIASGKDKGYSSIPVLDPAAFTPDADFFHITTNNTIYGTCYPTLPDTGHVPMIADMSSDILSKHYDVSQFGMIYAGAQKNLGPSGFAICIIREDLLDRSPEHIPNVFNYKKIAVNGSMYNTPPTFGIYICSLVLKWLKGHGGPEGIHQLNLQKSQLVYEFLDNSSLFHTAVQPPDRSIMNIPFSTHSEELDGLFIREAESQGLLQLKGHRVTGGMRASIYNAMPLEGVKALVTFMETFEMRHK